MRRQSPMDAPISLPLTSPGGRGKEADDRGPAALRHASQAVPAYCSTCSVLTTQSRSSNRLK
jgi:hypothetical protein